jgi:vacuolar-type H+-ATPase subunit C/Vma6
MIRTFRYAFILAKIYGMLARSFIGENYREILRLKRVQDIYDRLYPGERSEKPEHQLTAELEARIVQSGIATMIFVLDLMGEPEEILVHILRKFEYQGVKSLLRGLAPGVAGSAEGTAESPAAGSAPRGAAAEEAVPAQVWDLGRYGSVDLAHSRDPLASIEDSPYAWVMPLARTTPVVRIENMLDQEYYRRLLALTRALPQKDRTGVSRLVHLEIGLADVLWALRLRFSFGMDAEKARDLLIPGMLEAERRAVAQAFDIPADSIEGWRKWRFGWLVEDQLSESFQAPDPVRAEQKGTRRLYTRAHQLFHQDPFTLTPIVAFFKLKEYEVGLLKTAVEALRLSVSEQDVLALVGAT